jgi:hypothetical protein
MLHHAASCCEGNSVVILAIKAINIETTMRTAVCELYGNELLSASPVTPCTSCLPNTVIVVMVWGVLASVPSHGLAVVGVGQHSCYATQ